jgi:predicted RNase H-like HicB family nuclease
MAAHADKKLGNGPGRLRKGAIRAMQVKVVVHEAEEGGFWAEVPALAGCVSQGETMDELLANVREAIEAWLATEPPVEAGEEAGERRRVVELSL